MANYRRYRDGRLFFFTLVSHRRRVLFADAGPRRLLREAMADPSSARRDQQHKPADVCKDTRCDQYGSGYEDQGAVHHCRGRRHAAGKFGLNAGERLESFPPGEPGAQQQGQQNEQQGAQRRSRSRSPAASTSRTFWRRCLQQPR